MQDSDRVKQYHRSRRVLSVLGSVLDIALLAVLLASGWTILFRNFAERVSPHPPISLIVYLALIGLVGKAIGLPLNYYREFKVEHRFGLSNLTVRAWAVDQLKGMAVGGGLAILGVEFVYWTLRRWPAHWWIICACAFIGFFILLANLAPVLIFPIFFKFKPLENSALTERLVGLCARARTRVRGVFEWKLSEKSKKANAALMGLGNTRRIILADNLLDKFNEDEIEAVLAHELGHHVRRHIFQGIVLQAGATFLGFYIADAVLRRATAYFGFRGIADFANLPVLALAFTALSFLMLPFVNFHSRRMERQADEYALRSIPSAGPFVSSMEKLAEMNLAERRPPAWIEFIFHSHPSIEKRLTFAEKFSRSASASARPAGHSS
ncbi:MAG: M48 family metallopeptidase [Deltaproteobacteria bacterium]